MSTFLIRIQPHETARCSFGRSISIRQRSVPIVYTVDLDINDAIGHHPVKAAGGITSWADVDGSSGPGVHSIRVTEY